MAALPKKKISKVRSKTRRAHQHASLPRVIIDPKSGKPRLPHHIDPETGTYRGRTMVKTRLAKRLEKTLAKTKGAKSTAAAPKKPAAKKTALKTKSKAQAPSTPKPADDSSQKS